MQEMENDIVNIKRFNCWVWFLAVQFLEEKEQEKKEYPNEMHLFKQTKREQTSYLAPESPKGGGGGGGDTLKCSRNFLLSRPTLVKGKDPLAHVEGGMFQIPPWLLLSLKRVCTSSVGQ